VIQAFAIQAGALRTNPNSGPNGVGVQSGHAYTLDTHATQGVAICGAFFAGQGATFWCSLPTGGTWRNKGKIPILFAHPQSAGHGLNLQDGGNILVFFAHWWNLEERLQVIERIGPTRQLQAGHDRPVWIHNIIARKTVDELVIERVNTKREVQDILMGAMRRRKTEIGAPA
jgi:hypothetical protein